MTITKETVIAANRFGLGAKPGDLIHIGTDPRGWLLEQIKGPVATPARFKGLTDTAGVARLLRDSREMRRRTSGKDAAAGDGLLKALRPVYRQHALARSAHAIETSRPFHERLVYFWSNHFAVSVDKPALLGLAGPFELEAIRPHVNGYFIDLLMAAETHPAMLIYLDNIQSIGPNSILAKRAGRRMQNRHFDINENLAREILELHTLGVDGGYSQADVTAFARAITGWSIGGLGRFGRGSPGKFHFNELLHEPGAETILGKTYRQSGVRKGEAVLRDLAAHPATATHLATGLARHFIADDPPAAVVARLRETYLESGGFLPAVYTELIDSEEVWRAVHAKYKTPQEYVYSAFRAVDFVPGDVILLGALRTLGQAVWQPGSPAGWPDTATAWAGGEALFKRVEFAAAMAERIGNRADPEGLGLQVLGPALGGSSLAALRAAGSPSQGLALLFSSPEFQRR